MKMRRIGVYGLIVFFLLTNLASAAIIGDVSTWSVDGQDVDFTISDGSRLQLTVLAADTVRVRFATGGTLTDNVSRAVVSTAWPAESFTTTEDGDRISIETARLRIDVQKVPCTVTFLDSLGTLINADDPTRRIEWDSTYTRVYKTTQSGEDYVGLGWRPLGTLRKNGTRFLMRNYPRYTIPETFYGGVPFWYGIQNGKAYGIFFDDTCWGEINVGEESPDYMSFENLGGQIDYYLFYGPSIGKILEQYTELTGRPFMPPKWACGYQQCRWSYTPQSEVLSIADEFRTRDIPCDVMYLDIDYMPGGRALTFDGSSFPDPAGMLASLHGDGFHVVANISPFLMHDDPKYFTADTGGYLIKRNNGMNQNGWHDYWYYVGGATTGWLSWIDFSKTAACSWWAGQHTSFLSYGIDGIWNDLNEPDEFGIPWADDVKYDFDGNPTDHCETSTQYCLLQTGFTYQTLEDHYTNTRPFVVSRGAYAGIQRYSAVWSGDNTSNWSHLAMNIPMGLSMSISGQPHNGHDIGGFFGSPDLQDKPTGELFARWMQWGVFSGFCRGHHDGFGNREPGWPYVEPWEFGPTVENICREYIGLRYRLMPYLYSLYHQAHTTGAPIQRPTFYDFPNDAATLDQNHDFMFGPFMLVAPVVSEAATTKSAYLPSGSDWIDYWTDALYTGGQTVVVSAPLEVLPIFVREGAIIPMGPVMEYADEFTLDEITFETWPSTSPSSFDLYEDDGITFDYETGEYADVTLTQQLVSGMFRLDLSARSGSYVPGPRHFLVKVHHWSDPVTNVKLDGVPLNQYSNLTELRTAGTGYYYSATADIVYARFPDTGLAQTMVINEVSAVPHWEFY